MFNEIEKDFEFQASWENGQSKETFSWPIWKCTDREFSLNKVNKSLIIWYSFIFVFQEILLQTAINITEPYAAEKKIQGLFSHVHLIIN